VCKSLLGINRSFSLERVSLSLQPLPVRAGRGARLVAKCLIRDGGGDGAGALVVIMGLPLILLQTLCLLFLFLFGIRGSRILPY
jgi:hypothetical protein